MPWFKTCFKTFPILKFTKPLFEILLLRLTDKNKSVKQGNNPLRNQLGRGRGNQKASIGLTKMENCLSTKLSFRVKTGNKNLNSPITWVLTTKERTKQEKIQEKKSDRQNKLKVVKTYFKKLLLA